MDSPTTSETIDVLNQRVSVRGFKSDDISPETIDAILAAAFRAPTSSNIQSYSVIVVREKSVKEALAPITGGQKHVIEAPVFLAFCADLTRIEAANQRNGKTVFPNNLEVGLVSSIDAALVGMSAYLAADSLGIKGVMIGAVRNDAEATAQVLGLPKGAYCVFGMCLGWPTDIPKQKPRIARAATVHYEQYGKHTGNRPVTDVMEDYDQDLAVHYNAIGKATTSDSWSQEITKQFNPQRREDLREQLRNLGFDFR